MTAFPFVGIFRKEGCQTPIALVLAEGKVNR